MGSERKKLPEEKLSTVNQLTHSMSSCARVHRVKISDLYKENKRVNNWGSVGAHSSLANLFFRRNISLCAWFTD